MCFLALYIVIWMCYIWCNVSKFGVFSMLECSLNIIKTLGGWQFMIKHKVAW